MEDTIFCNDRSTVAGGNNNTLSSSTYGTKGFGPNYTGYGALARASYYTINPSPSLVCPNANDKFTVDSAKGNGKLTYPVGLITLDEAILAGFNTNKSNSSNYEDTNNYLYTGQDYWTLSPVRYWSSGAYLGVIDSDGKIYDSKVSNFAGLRPVVSLAPGTRVAVGGEGTSTKPYVVE